MGAGAAILAGGAISAGATIFGAKKGSEAAREGSQRATDTQLQMYYQNRRDIGPWIGYGRWAIKELAHKVSHGPGKFDPKKDPGYKFGYREFVQKPTMRMASATGGLRSGRTQKALTRYASDYASTKYDQFLSRYYDSLKPLQSLTGQGQTSANALAQLGTQTGRNVGAYQYAGQIGQGNALMAGAAGLSGIGNRMMDWYQMQNYLNPQQQRQPQPYFKYPPANPGWT